MAKLKRCTNCGHWLSVSSFHRQRTNPSGYRSSCKACRVQPSAVYYASHRSSILATRKAARRDNVEVAREKGRTDYQRHRDDYIARAGAWGAANPTRVRAIKRNYKHKRREKTRSVGKPPTLARIVERDGTDCSICGRPVDFSLGWPNHGYPSMDHVVPLSKGGTHAMDNVALAHWICNVQKQAKVIS